MSPFGTSALSRVVRSGVSRRRVQTSVIAIATMMAVASAVVAGSLMVAVAAPFDHAFKKQRGAHITAQFDPAKVSTAKLAATGKLDGVTASAGPYSSTAFRPVDQTGFRLPTLTLVGRSSADGAVDRVELKSGRWVRKPGEIVLSTSFEGPDIEIGSTLRTSGTANAPALKVVGFALSASKTADSWAIPAQVDAVASQGRHPVTQQMLYRFDSAATKQQILADRMKLASATSSGALLGTQSWLDTKRATDQGAAATVPFVMAFGVLGIVMSVIIVSSVISGAVGTGLRRIGILKAIGFTPREVVRAYVAQPMIPAIVGITLGALLGNLLAVPMLSDTESVYSTTSLSVAWWVDVAVPAATLLVVGFAALIPARRAGRLHTVEAIAVGRAPRTGRGQRAHRVLGRLPLPRPVTYGLATPFTHPVRALAMLLAVAFGTIAVTFAVGLTSSLGAISTSQDPESRASVTVTTVRLNNIAPPPPPVVGGEAGPSSLARSMPEPTKAKVADPAEVRSAIKSQAGLDSYYGKLQTEVVVAGVSGSVQASLYEGDSHDGSYEMLSGHWLTGKGQVVVPTRFLERTSAKVGDTVRVTYETESADLKIVGESFDTSGNQLEIHADMADFPSAEPSTFLVKVKAGVSADDYARKLASTVHPLGGDATAVPPAEQKGVLLIMKAMAGLLTLMLAAVAGLGVLNSVILDTRERVHDLGVCKAIGMTPRQTVSLVLASVAAIGVIGGLLGVPVGYMLHGLVMPMMARAVGTTMPAPVLDVYGPTRLLLLGLGGVVLAVLGALAPAGWAARTCTATALRTE